MFYLRNHVYSSSQPNIMGEKFSPKSYSTWLNDDDEDETTADHSAIDHREAPPKQTTTQHDTLGLSDSLSFTIGTDQMFSLGQIF